MYVPVDCHCPDRTPEVFSVQLNREQSASHVTRVGKTSVPTWRCFVRAALGVRLYNHPAANLDLVRPGLPPNLRGHALTVRVNAESSAEGFVQAALGGRLYNHPAADLDLVRPGLPPNLREDVRSRSE